MSVALQSQRAPSPEPRCCVEVRPRGRSAATPNNNPLQKHVFDPILSTTLVAGLELLLKITIALATVAVLGFGVVAHGQNATTVITIKAGEINGTGQGRGLTIRIGDVAIVSADRFELEQPATIRLLGDVQLGVDPARTPSFAVRVPSAGGLNLRLLDVVITATGIEPDYQAGVLRLLGDVRIRQERPALNRQ